MAVIAIARELAALGEEVAEKLVGITGYRYIDREYLEKRLGDLGIGPEKRQKYDERKPGLWASLSQERDDYLHYLKTVLFEEAAVGDCIIMGRGATAVLKELPHLVPVRLTAPVAVRAERVRGFYACDERRALQIIEQSDHDRAGFQKYFFSVDWRDSREYALTLNTGEMDAATAARVIDALRLAIATPEREAAGARRIADLLLGQSIVTAIVYGKRVPVHFLEADCDAGKAVLHGVANTQSAIEAAIKAAAAVPGVSSVESSIQIVQEFAVMP
jgi:cytidylate kinase